MSQPEQPPVADDSGRQAPVVELAGIEQIYGKGEMRVHALRGIDLTVASGEQVAIMGPSGSGKSTMMNLIGCLDVPTSGRYRLDGLEVGDLGEAELARVRNRRIGFVFQSFNLIARMSALANVELPLVYGGIARRERRERALAALESVGLAERGGHQPHQLSGGQQQRVAVARALVTEPALLLADEPTGNLDAESTEDVLRLFEHLGELGRTIVLITHEAEVGARADRLVTLADGVIVEDRPRTRGDDSADLDDTVEFPQYAPVRQGEGR